MVRIVSWNVNGLRTLKPSLKAVFESLHADIVCVQETRISQSDVDLERLALVPGYESFFSFCSIRNGYSGVATFTKNGLPCSKGRGSLNLTPRDAGEGLANAVGGAVIDVIPNLSATQDLQAACCDEENLSPCIPLVVSADELELIRSEGRVVITDHERFVLINVYLPAVSVDGRAKFKLAVCRALELKVRALREAGRNVVIVGDFNIAPSSCDVAEPVDDMSSFNSRPSRQWLRSVLLGEIGLKDSFRELHPSFTSAYTCWSEATRARENNFGARIDLILVDEELFHAHVVAANILCDVTGSDHCPISLELRAGIMGCCMALNTPPPFCTRYLSRFSAKQLSIRDMLDCGSHAGQEPFDDSSRSKRKRSSIEIQMKNSVLCEGQLSEIERSGRNSNAEDASRGRGHRQADPKEGKRPRISLGPNAVPLKGRQVHIRRYFTPVPKGASRVTDANACPSRFPQPSEFMETPAASVRDDDAVSLPSDKSNDRLINERFKGAAAAWKQLLSGPPAAPLCRHREPCKLKSVKKSGENKGRTFYGCHRPAGDWPKDKSANCNFFQWAPYRAGGTMSQQKDLRPR
jgi:AP endonuclease 2